MPLNLVPVPFQSQVVSIKSCSAYRPSFPPLDLEVVLEVYLMVGLCKWGNISIFSLLFLPSHPLPPSLHHSLQLCLPPPSPLTCWNKLSNYITRFPGLTSGSRERAQFERASVIRGGGVISRTQLGRVYKRLGRQLYLFCFIKQRVPCTQASQNKYLLIDGFIQRLVNSVKPALGCPGS